MEEVGEKGKGGVVTSGRGWETGGQRAGEGLYRVEEDVVGKGVLKRIEATRQRAGLP